MCSWQQWHAAFERTRASIVPHNNNNNDAVLRKHTPAAIGDGGGGCNTEQHNAILAQRVLAVGRAHAAAARAIAHVREPTPPRSAAANTQNRIAHII